MSVSPTPVHDRDPAISKAWTAWTATATNASIRLRRTDPPDKIDITGLPAKIAR